ncbi:tail completion protein gp17 [Enterococcus sp. AZ103]|uniref:tail completion protein gp17 n=1 Tax=Enterococcus sp. AZ103 TaxID=2774628 RepID=UPI003F274E40
MLEQLSLSDLLVGVIDVLKKNIKDIQILDHVPKNQKLPFVSVELIGVEPIPSKTMWKDKYQIYIHGWADGSKGSLPIFDLADKIREAMTVEVQLPDGFELLIQKPEGAQRILEDESKTRHAVLGYSLTVTYGFKFKI